MDNKFPLTEEVILNEDFQSKHPGVRRFRIEYGFECSCPEGLIYLPAGYDPDLFEEFLETIPWTCKCYDKLPEKEV